MNSWKSNSIRSLIARWEASTQQSPDSIGGACQQQHNLNPTFFQPPSCVEEWRSQNGAVATPMLPLTVYSMLVRGKRDGQVRHS